ncbi:ADP-ribosylation factor-like protein 6-interacting protein 4 isoform X2 [Physella acuta]|uniref:ADP-ribosylation factor-like protein 6-interacting protein 4 isoform X2 n=1 Tax=Physella acuta TaxID=109671 RepID=UPI0027DCBFCE|nr:ADP-ribosylation factor-like protein 6-interacting protein 4 isoform X2 [Physella acuta]
MLGALTAWCFLGSRSSSAPASASPEKKKKVKKKKKKKTKNKQKRRKSLTPVDNLKLKDVKILPIAPTEDVPTGKRSGPKPRVMKPMTKEEWEKQQSVVRRVYDEETGRERLIKGDGEILEEIVSKNRHLEINKTATRGDGQHYAKQMGLY